MNKNRKQLLEDIIQDIEHANIELNAFKNDMIDEENEDIIDTMRCSIDEIDSATSALNDILNS